METERWLYSMRSCIKCDMPQVGDVQYCITPEGNKFRCTTCGATWGAGTENNGETDNGNLDLKT